MSVKCNQNSQKCDKDAVFFCIDGLDEFDDTEFLSCEDCEKSYIEDSDAACQSRYIYFPTYEDLQVELIKRRL